MRLLLISLLGLCLVTPVRALADDYPVVGQLKTRNHLIVIQNSPGGLLFTIKTHEGTVVEHQITEDWIASTLPDLHEILIRGIARPQSPSDADQDKIESTTASQDRDVLLLR